MSGLFIGWGETYPGREEQALHVFNEVLANNGKLVEEGRIGGFEPFLLGAHGGGLRGFFILRGTPEQILALRTDDEFLGYVMRGQMVASDFGVEELYFGESLEHLMGIFEQRVGALA